MLTRPIEWLDQLLSIDGHAISLRVPRCPNDVLVNVVKSQTDNRSDPYWGSLWPTATVMAGLVMREHWSDAANTLELGCGCGLVGVAGLTAGLDVTFSDLVPDAVALSIHNANENGFEAAKSLVLDWRLPLPLNFDVLLASDVLYQPEVHAALIVLISRMLSVGGVCWIGDPGRTAACDFLHGLHAAGLSYQLRNEHGASTLMPTPGQFCLIVIRRTMP